MAEFGIGRVPRDVDTTKEIIAEAEAADIVRPMLRHDDRPLRPCARCGQLSRYLMTSCGPGEVCADCYDDVAEGRW